MQVPRYTPHEGKPYLLHVMRVLRFKTFRQCHQDRFPGSGRKADQEQDRIISFLQHLPLIVDIIIFVMCHFPFADGVLGETGWSVFRLCISAPVYTTTTNDRATSPHNSVISVPFMNNNVLAFVSRASVWGREVPIDTTVTSFP